MAPAEKPKLGRVLVIGGCGFLGHHVVNVLLRDYEADASVIDLRCSRHRRPDSDGVAYYEADITDNGRMTELFEKIRPDVIIHTASPAAQANDPVAHELFKKVNVDGTQTVVDVSKATGVKALVFTSSASVMSDNVSDLINIDERWPVVRGKEQTVYYSETKAAAEEIVLKANTNTKEHKFLTCAIRPSAIFGEGDAMATYHMINIHRRGQTWIQIGDNNNLFDFTYAENVAHAHLLGAHALLMTHRSSMIPLEHERVDGEAFLITNDQPVYFWDFTRAVWRAAGSPLGLKDVWVMPRDLGLFLGYLSEVYFALTRKPPTFNRQRVTFSCMTRYYNITKAKRRLGYKPLVSLDVAVRQSVKWFLEKEKLGAIQLIKSK